MNPEHGPQIDRPDSSGAGDEEGRKNDSTWIVLLVFLLLPLMFLFLAPVGLMTGGPAWYGMFLFFCLAMIWILFAAAPVDRRQEAGPRGLQESEYPGPVREVMDVRVAQEEGGVRMFRGSLRKSPGEALWELQSRLEPGTMPLVQEDEQLPAAIYLVPRRIEEKSRPSHRRWVPWTLFALTAITTTWAGAAHQGIDLLREPGRFSVGLPYAAALLLILGLHELAHYLVARRNGLEVAGPYFIPVPFGLGTFGAFIQTRTPPANRRVLFDGAIAGPLAGLVAAIPALIIGLQSSTVIDMPGREATASGTSVGSSIFLALLAKVSLGTSLQEGHVLSLSPLAFAGWLGLFITALNLMPIGLLDGGHIAHGMFGRRLADRIGNAALWTLLLLAFFVWPGLLIWALVALIISGPRSPPLNDLTPISPNRRRLGALVFVLALLILIPLPHAFWQPAGIACPYL